MTEHDVLIMATDGLWDVVSNHKVAQIVDTGLKISEKAEEVRQKYRFISIAQELVMAARGKLVERNWKHSDDSPATIDDISVFVIPILHYKREYADWKTHRSSQQQNGNGNSTAANGNSTADSLLEEKFVETSGDENNMEIDPAEEVTVSEVNLAIKDDDDDEDTEESDEKEDEAEK